MGYLFFFLVACGLCVVTLGLWFLRRAQVITLAVASEEQAPPSQSSKIEPKTATLPQAALAVELPGGQKRSGGSQLQRSGHPSGGEEE